MPSGSSKTLPVGTWIGDFALVDFLDSTRISISSDALVSLKKSPCRVSNLRLCGADTGMFSTSDTARPSVGDLLCLLGGELLTWPSFPQEFADAILLEMWSRRC